MFEKIGTPKYATLSNPCKEFLFLLSELKKEKRPLVAAEVGVGIGATTLQILKILGLGDTLYLFDFQDVIDAFTADIAKHSDYANGVNIISLGNSRKTYDSFNWRFAEIILQKLYVKESPQIFDAVYLDGAHTFMHTTAACCLLKKMLKPSGYLVFDDVFWTLAGYRGRKPEAAESLGKGYTEEQINTPHVAMVVDIFMRTDPEYSQVHLCPEKRAPRVVFQKLP